LAQLFADSKEYRPSGIPFFFSHDGKETKDLALAARRPFTALGAKTAKLASLEQTPFLRSLRPKGPRLRSLGRLYPDYTLRVVASNSL